MFKGERKKLYLGLVNNTAVTQSVSLFNNGNNSEFPLNISNTPLYTFDVTSFVFTTEQTVSIQQKLVGASSFTTFTASVTNGSFQGVCDALNTLGFGNFYTYSSGGNTYISVYSSSYVFGSLNIYDSVSVNVNYNVYSTSFYSVDLKPSSVITPPPIATFNTNNPLNAYGLYNPALGNLVLQITRVGVQPNLYVLVYKNGTLIDTITFNNPFGSYGYTAVAADIFEVDFYDAIP